MHKYRLQRRQIGPIYSVSSISELDEPLDIILTKSLASMRHTAGSVIDLDTWCHMFALGNAQWLIIRRRNRSGGILVNIRHAN